MTLILNTQKMKLIRKVLRHNQTEAERLLWQKLRNKRLAGLKFYRQFSVGRYVLDFYCPELRLCIELDGSQHVREETIEYDKERTKFLNSLRIKVIRFWNSEIISNMKGVLESLPKECNSYP